MKPKKNNFDWSTGYPKWAWALFGAVAGFSLAQFIAAHGVNIAGG